MAIKKTLLRRILANRGIEVDLTPYRDGLSVVFSYADEVAAARDVYAFSMEHDGMRIECGVLENEVISAERVKRLAQLPGREGLLGQLVRTIQSPVTGFVNVLSGTIRGLVVALSAIKESKETSA